MNKECMLSYLEEIEGLLRDGKTIQSWNLLKWLIKDTKGGLDE